MYFGLHFFKESENATQLLHCMSAAEVCMCYTITLMQMDWPSIKLGWDAFDTLAHKTHEIVIRVETLCHSKHKHNFIQCFIFRQLANCWSHTISLFVHRWLIDLLAKHSRSMLRCKLMICWALRFHFGSSDFTWESPL